MIHVSAAVLLLAFGLAASSFAEEASANRDTYDSYIGVFAIHEHLNSCELHAPAVVAESRVEVSAFRNVNDAKLRRLEPAARKWQLPGDRQIDEVLEHIRKSTSAYYADAPVGVTADRCQKLLATLMASNKPLERTRGK
jgi:hypothetical protein